MPGADVEIIHPRFRHGGHIGQGGPAFRHGHSQGADAPFLDNAGIAREIIHRDLNVARKHGRDGLRRATEGNMRAVNAGAPKQIGAGKVNGRTHPRRPVANAAAPRLGPGDEFLERLRRHMLRRHRHHIGQIPHGADPCEIALGIIGQGFEQHGVDHHIMHADRADGVAIGRGPRDGFRADIAGSAGTCLHNEILPEAARQDFAGKPRHHIKRPTRRKANKNAHGPIGPGGLRNRGAGQAKGEWCGEKAATLDHVFLPLFVIISARVIRFFPVQHTAPSI